MIDYDIAYSLAPSDWGLSSWTENQWCGGDIMTVLDE